jgi:tripartite ATP-independent transporter DctM subunit
VILAATVLVFVALLVLSLPIVFCLGAAGVTGLWLGGFPMQQLGSSLIAASQSWVLLAIPSFVFAGSLMERAGMSHSLVELARALVGWLRGGLGMSVIVVSYFFSDICGSKMAEVSALSSALVPPLRRAGYTSADAASLIASGTAMGMLVPPAIFMIVISAVTNQSAVALFLAGFIPAAVIGICLCILVLIQAHVLGWPKDTALSWHRLLHASREAAVPMVIPVVILGGFYLGAFTATEAGAIVALYSLLAAVFYYRNVSWMQVLHIAYESGVLTGVVIFLLAVATIFQYLMGLSGVPDLLGRLLGPLEASHWMFLTGVAIMTMLFGMLLEGLPAAVVLIPVVFPIATKIGIHPVHFDIVQTAAVGIGLFMPPMGVGLLMALRFADVSVFDHARHYWPYLLALLVGLMLVICIPELSLFLPRSAGFIKSTG